VGGPDWLYFTLAGILGVLSLWLFYRGLFADRSRGRKRCPKCFYDLSAAPSNTCPECGRVIKKPRHYHKTRRYRRRTALALFCGLLAGSAGFFPHLRAVGWTTYLPNTALIWLLRTVDSETEPLWVEFQRRHIIRIKQGITARRRGEPAYVAGSALDRTPARDSSARWFELMRDLAQARAFPGSNVFSADSGPLGPGHHEPEASYPYLEQLNAWQRRLLAESCGSIIKNGRSVTLEFGALLTLEALGRDGAPATPAIVCALRGESLRTEDLALHVLSVFGPEAAPAVPEVVRRLLQGSSAGWVEPVDGWDRARLVELAGRIGPAAAPAIPELCKILQSQDGRNARLSAWALGKIGPAAAEAIPDLLSARHIYPMPLRAVTRIDPSHTDVRAAYLEALSSSGHRSAAIEGILTQPDLHDDAAAILDRQLQGDEAWDRINALRGLAELPAPYGVDVAVLGRYLNDDESVSVRAEAAAQLSRKAEDGDASAAAVLDEALTTGDATTRQVIRVAGWKPPDEREDDAAGDTTDAP
jgi:hypothetical protein